jgi:hypothetical protein
MFCSFLEVFKICLLFWLLCASFWIVYSPMFWAHRPFFLPLWPAVNHIHYTHTHTCTYTYIHVHTYVYTWGTGVWTQGLQLEPLHQPIFWGVFSRQSLKNYLPGLTLIHNPPISAFWIARIIGVTHWHLAQYIFFFFSIYFVFVRQALYHSATSPAANPSPPFFCDKFSLLSQGHDPPTSASQILGLQTFTITPGVMILLFVCLFYSYVHIRLGSFLPPAPTPSLTTHSAPSLSPTPSIPSRNYFALISNFVVERV